MTKQSPKRIFTTNSIHDTPNGRVRIIEYWNLSKAKSKGFSNTRAIIEFVDTGYVCNVQVSNIKQGKVKDKRIPSVYGVGYLDCDIKIPARSSGSEIRRIYDTWANMLKRCYGNYGDVSYESVEVDPRWHSFKNFLNSVPELKGYDEWRLDSSMHLDKDMLDPSNRIYSKDTCQFVSAFDNVSEGANRRWGNA